MTPGQAARRLPGQITRAAAISALGGTSVYVCVGLMGDRAIVISMIGKVLNFTVNVLYGERSVAWQERGRSR